MDIASRSIFIILTAMVIASSILSVASLTLMNALSGDIFSKRDGKAEGSQSVYRHVGDDVQRTREKILNYPRKMFMIYGFSFGLAILLAAVYLGPLQVQDDKSILVRYISVEFGQSLHQISSRYVFPGVVTFYLAYCVYVVLQAKVVCNNVFILKDRA